MVKVAYLFGSLNRGGTETLYLDFFRQCDCADFEMIGIHRKDGVLKDDFYATNVKMIKCECKKNILAYISKLKKILVENNISIVHAQQSLDCVYAYLATIGTNIKVVETFHGYDFGITKKDRFINSLSVKMSDLVCFVSKTQMDYYVDAYKISEKKKKFVVYNGVDFSKLDNFSEKIEECSKLNKIDSAQPRGVALAMVGNFVRVREQNSVCKFLKILKDNNIPFDFFFVGKRDDNNPTLYDDCVKYCEENGLSNNVHFLGSRSDVPQILKQIDAFVYSTDHDTFGIAVVEAIASGLPTFVNDWGVMKEITLNGSLATLYKTKNPQDLFEKFVSFYNDRENSLIKAKQNAIEIRDLFSIQKFAIRLNEVYCKI